MFKKPLAKIILNIICIISVGIVIIIIANKKKNGDYLGICWIINAKVTDESVNEVKIPFIILKVIWYFKIEGFPQRFEIYWRGMIEEKTIQLHPR